MAYRFTRKADVQDEARRIAREQMDKALDEIEDSDLSLDETVHQVRKRCKKVRALLRLVRGALEDDTYSAENAWYRDTARQLAPCRDAQVVLDTWRGLLSDLADEAKSEELKPVEEELARRRAETAGNSEETGKRLIEAGDRLRDGRKRVATWTLAESAFDALSGGLKKTYRRGRKGLSKAYADLTAESFHEWRKRAKYHWYHCRLLRDLWGEVIQVRAGEAHRLATILGDAHDLSVLRATLSERPSDFGGYDVVEEALDLIDRRREDLRLSARPLGERLQAEKPKALVKRLRVYDQAWRVTEREDDLLQLPDV